MLGMYTGVNSFTFLLNTDGLYLFTDEMGRYYLATTINADSRMEMGDIVAYDANARHSLGTMTATTVTPGQQYQLTVTIDNAFLTDSNTAYPVMIDPSFQVSDQDTAGAIEDAGIFSNKLSLNAGGWIYNNAGYYDSNYGIGRTVYRLAGLISSSQYTQITAADQIISAEFSVKEASGNSAQTVNLHPLTGNSTWTESGVTWGDVEDYDQNYCVSASMGSNTWAEYDITGLVRAWKSGTYNINCGFVLIRENEGNASIPKKTIYTSEHSSTASRPCFILNYYADAEVVELSKNQTTTLSVELVSGSVPSWTSSNTNVATVNASTGAVTAVDTGFTTISVSVAGVVHQVFLVYVSMSDGYYRLQSNYATTKYIAVKDGSIKHLTQTVTRNITNSQPSSASQIWKVKYLGEGNYSIRPLHKINMGLKMFGSLACIADVGTTDTRSALPNDAEWRIQTAGNGSYVLVNDLEPNTGMKATSTADGGSIWVDTYTAGNSAYQWRFTSAGNHAGIQTYNSTTGLPTGSTIIAAKTGDVKTTTQLGIVASAFSTTGNVSSITWSSGDTSLATVNQSSGTVSCVSHGEVLIFCNVIFSDGTTARTSYLLTVIPNVSGVNIDNIEYANFSTVQLETQERSNWCWVACARMMAKHYAPMFNTTVTTNQTQAVTHVKGSPKDEMGTLQEIISAVHYYLSPTSGESNLDLVCAPEPGTVSELGLISYIDSGDTLIIGGHTAGNVYGHALLLYGYLYIENQHLFILHDPKQSASQSVVLTYSELCDELPISEDSSDPVYYWGSTVAVRSIHIDPNYENS